MLRLLKKAKQLMGRCRVVGWRSAIKAEIAPQGTLIDIRIHDFDLRIRARTPDLRVAIESLTNEYRFLSDCFHREISGCIIDAGGYIGTSAILFAKKFPNAKIIVIEPSSENIDILKYNTKKFKNIYVKHAALFGVVDSKKKTLKNRGTGQWGFTLVDSPEDVPTAPDIETTDILTIEDICTEYGEDIKILKLDVEGSEKAILESSALKRIVVPLLVIELHDRILSGCSKAFFDFSKDRWVVKLDGEKYLSLNR